MCHTCILPRFITNGDVLSILQKECHITHPRNKYVLVKARANKTLYTLSLDTGTKISQACARPTNMFSDRMQF